MKQYTNTYRITISDDMKYQLDQLKFKYNIKPTAFIRLAIAERIKNELPKLQAPKPDIDLPF